MQRKLKILYISAEIAPFVKTGSLAEVAGSLPKGLKDLGHDIRLFIPKYSTINERKYIIREVIRLKEIQISLHNKMTLANVKSAFLPNSKVQVYFVENKDYFDRPHPFIDEQTNKTYSDEAERFIFFCFAVFSILEKLHWQPDIIHCNDWQTALIPFLLKTFFSNDPFFNRIKTLLTIHDLSSQGIFDSSVVSIIGDPAAIFYPNSPLEQCGRVNFLKAGLIQADLINTTSKSMTKEIQTSDQASFGLKEIFRSRSKDLYGVINGVDYSIWNPENDTYIPQQYSRKDIALKAINKQKLVESVEMRFDAERPVIGMLTQHLSLDFYEMLTDIIAELKKMPAQLIVAGSESQKHPKLVHSLLKKYSEYIGFHWNLDDQFEHLMVAGCDMFLIPCPIEPCGSIQLRCLKYGTIPIANATGSLLDTVKDFDQSTKKGTGFLFREFSAHSLIETLRQAIAVFQDKEIWKKLVDRAMRLNFSWQVAADNYDKLYYQLMD